MEQGQATTARTGTTAVDRWIVVGLVAIGAFARRSAAELDGFWHDDAWVVVGARAPFAELLTVCTNHPGFTLGLQVINRVAPDHVEALAWPALAAGVATAPILYLVARRLAYGALVAAPVASLVAFSEPHVVYSGRVKPYVIEAALVAVLGVAVHVLARRTWRPWWGVAWVVAALACASTGAFGFVAAALATLVLFLHPAGDRPLRLAVLGVQAALQGAAGLVMTGNYDSAQVAEDWERIYDGYIEPSADVVDLASQVGRHSARLGQAWVDVPSPVALVLVGLAVAGLGAACVRGSRRPAARFFAALLAVAFVGGLAGQIPFGPEPLAPVFPGGRASLWLFPSLAFGLAEAIDLVRRRVAAHRPGVATVWVAAFGAGALVVGVAGLSEELVYGEVGTQSATAFIEDRREPGAPVFFFGGGGFAVGSVPPVFVGVRANPDSIVGFDPVVGSDRVLVPPPGQLTRVWVDGLVGDSTQVIVHNSFVGLGDGARGVLAEQLGQLGFREESTLLFGGVNIVEVWVRSSGPPP